jgi:hypothetical protein
MNCPGSLNDVVAGRKGRYEVVLCTQCGEREAAGFFDSTGLFVDTVSDETVASLGVKPICRLCAAVQVATTWDASEKIGFDDK